MLEGDAGLSQVAWLESLDMPLVDMPPVHLGSAVKLG